MAEIIERGVFDTRVLGRLSTADVARQLEATRAAMAAGNSGVGLAELLQMFGGSFDPARYAAMRERKKAAVDKAVQAVLDIGQLLIQRYTVQGTPVQPPDGSDDATIQRWQANLLQAQLFRSDLAALRNAIGNVVDAIMEAVN